MPTNITSEKSYFTYASGSKYLALAFALARSYRYHNKTDIGFYIASNEDYHLPWDLKWVNKLIFTSKFLGNGLAFKLKLHIIAPTRQSIFIDADSLVYDDISFLFDEFAHQAPTVIGLKVTKGIFVDENVENTCKEFNIDYMVRYCGAFYYLIKNEKTFKTFDYAQQLNNSGRPFQRSATTIYDEPVLSIALAKHHIEPIKDDGNIWGDLAQNSYDNEINVFNKKPIFYNNLAAKNYKFWLPEGKYSPKILHVGSGNYNKKPWLFDALRLKLHYKFWLPVWLSNIIVKLVIITPYHLARKILRS